MVQAVSVQQCRGLILILLSCDIVVLRCHLFVSSQVLNIIQSEKLSQTFAIL
jgi:hypothetical protein